MEAQERLGLSLDLADADAEKKWEPHQTWVRPNLGKSERWMPYHTVLGVHELFIVQHIHHAKVPCWTDERRFLAMFIYRAHCKSELFQEVQLPHLSKASFWENPSSHFDVHGSVWQAMLEYRIKTRSPLITSAFRCIPARVREDDDENLVHDIAQRTQTLLSVAQRVWPIVNDGSKSVSTKFEEISTELKKGRGLGETWSKMLMVSIDIANPKMGLLAQNCDVGVGAEPGLRKLVPLHTDAKNALVKLTASANRAALPSVRHFWDLLPKVERCAKERYRDYPLILAQMSTPIFSLSAVTVQVQLCEWRQFHAVSNRSRAKGAVASKAGVSKSRAGEDVPLVRMPGVGVKVGSSPNRADEDIPLAKMVLGVRPPTSSNGGSKRPAPEPPAEHAKRQCAQGKTALAHFKDALQNVVARMSSEDDNAVAATLSAERRLEELQTEVSSASQRVQEMQTEMEQKSLLVKQAEAAFQDAQAKKHSSECEHKLQEAAWQKLKSISQEEWADESPEKQLQLLLRCSVESIKPDLDALLATLKGEDGDAHALLESMSDSLQSALKRKFADIDDEVKSRSQSELEARTALHKAGAAYEKAYSHLQGALDQYADAATGYQQARRKKNKSSEAFEKQSAVLHGLRNLDRLVGMEARAIKEWQRGLV
jgi:hypothetical protein